MIYAVLILALLAVAAGSMAYISMNKNKSLKKEMDSLRRCLSAEMSLRKIVEEANKTYVQKLATLSKGTDSDRFASAVAVMSDNSVSPSKPNTKP